MPQTFEELAHQVANDEYRQSARALAVESPERARRTSQRRLDATLVTHSRGRTPLACRDGCDMCCSLRVVATAPEVFALVDFLRSTLTPVQVGEFEQRVRDRAGTVATMSMVEHLHTNVACPVLAGGRCLGYAARPMMCRGYHSTNREACEHAYNFPFDTMPRRGVLPARDVASDAHQHGWRGALGEHRYDSGRYELIRALAEAISNEDARARFMARRQAFTFDADDASEQADVAMGSNRPSLPAGHISLAD